ncbi:MAG: alpha/beta hydrolase [Spongiibacteraceae bacterium]
MSIHGDSTLHVEPVSKTYRSQGLTLHYLDWGNETAPPLLLVHGMWDHARSWDWIARELRHDWHVIAPDLRGHGDSDWSPDGAYLASYYLLDFADLIDTLGYAQINIVAHSFGGNPATRYAALYPERVRKLVLIDAMGPTAPVVARWNELGTVKRMREWLEKRRDTEKAQRRFASVEEAAERLMKTNKLLTSAYAHHLALHGVRRHSDGYSWKQDPVVGNFLPEDFAIDLAEYWRKITASTLICWGSESWTTNPATDGRSAYFRDHRNLTFEHAGHWLHHDQFDKFVAALQEFL